MAVVITGEASVTLLEQATWAVIQTNFVFFLVRFTEKVIIR